MTTHLKRFPLALLAGLPGLTLGCTGHRSPTFKVTDATLVEQSPDTSIILVTIEGENPNADALPLYSVKYRASLNDSEIFGAERSPERTIPRFSRASFTVPVVVANSALPSVGADISLRGSVVYQVPGTIAEVFFDSNIRRPSASVSGSATVNLDATVPAP